MPTKNCKIYCAGPLFNPKEREEMDCVASSLKNDGFDVFLPQENGLEFAKLLPIFIKKGFLVEEATRILNMAIFSLDVFEIMNSQGLVLNMNGRVPDEGAMVEAGIAWAHDKVLVIFRNDERSLLQGNCNPLVMGLANFDVVNKYENIPQVFKKKFLERSEGKAKFSSSRFDTAKNKGQKISNYLNHKKTIEELTNLLITIFEEETCPTSKRKKEASMLQQKLKVEQNS